MMALTFTPKVTELWKPSSYRTSISPQLTSFPVRCGRRESKYCRCGGRLERRKFSRGHRVLGQSLFCSATTDAHPRLNCRFWRLHKVDVERGWPSCPTAIGETELLHPSPTDGAIPPALICATCARNSALQKLGADRHALGIFHKDIEKAAFHQLELSAMHFDLLRSFLGISRCSVFYDSDWWRRWVCRLSASASVAVFDARTAQDEKQDSGLDWFGTRRRGMRPSGTRNHPWIDRFFMAETKNRMKCSVLYQDKVNAAGFPNTVGDMNLAAWRS